LRDDRRVNLAHVPSEARPREHGWLIGCLPSRSDFDIGNARYAALLIFNAPHTERRAGLATVVNIGTHCRIFAAMPQKAKTMQPRSAIAVLALCALAIPALAADMPATPYTGQQARQIKALSDEDITALHRGEGMAKAAELNGYLLGPCACARKTALAH
jgi:hypothetical protein